MPQKKPSSHMKYVNRLKTLMLTTEILIIILLATAISSLTFYKTDEVLKTKVISMTEALNVQMKMNLNSYLLRMETTGTLVFSQETVYEYDATKTVSDAYETIQQEVAVEGCLYDISILENFVDFGIVYRNNHAIGKFSNGTHALFGDRLYEDLSAMITNPSTADGWGTGYQENYKRLYYVKQVNENAILVLSFYTFELNDVFRHPGGIEDITVQLVADDNTVIYATDSELEGLPLPADILQRIEGKTSASIADDDYLITVNHCGNHLRIVCSAPTQIILKEKNDVMVFIIGLSLVAVIFASFVITILMARISKPMTQTVSTLNNEAQMDLLTGIYNKRTFEKNVEQLLRNTTPDCKKALILLDVDNFKGVNDTLGHAYGDKVLANVGDILKRVFQVDDVLGRLGGDEFCVYLNISDIQQKNYRNHIEQKCQELCREFHNNYTGDDNSYKISASIGVSICHIHGDTFHDLYQAADQALYHSKHAGKDTFTILPDEPDAEVKE